MKVLQQNHTGTANTPLLFEYPSYSGLLVLVMAQNVPIQNIVQVVSDRMICASQLIYVV